jgi:hypothetical protein
MSQHCGFILKKYLCCSTQGFDSIDYSWSHSAPISCSPLQDLVITGFVVSLFFIMMFSMVGTVVIVGVLLFKSRKTQDGFESIE